MVQGPINPREGLGPLVGGSSLQAVELLFSYGWCLPIGGWSCIPGVFHSSACALVHSPGSGPSGKQDPCPEVATVGSVFLKTACLLVSGAMSLCS